MPPRTKYFTYYVDVTLPVSTYPTCRVLGQMQTKGHKKKGEQIRYGATCNGRNMRTEKEREKKGRKEKGKKGKMTNKPSNVFRPHTR